MPPTAYIIRLAPRVSFLESGMRGRHTLETGEPYQAEYRIITGGEVRWVDARGKIEKDAEGKVVRFFGVPLDITERVHAACF
jgi:PAS domain-containing protein